MADHSLVRQIFLRSLRFNAASAQWKAFASFYHFQIADYGTSATADAETAGKNEPRTGKWLTLPPFLPSVDGVALGKVLAGRKSGSADMEADGGTTSSSSTMTALKWVLRCCPKLPRCLVHKLFRLRQVRRGLFYTSSSGLVTETQECFPKRVAAKDTMNIGDQIFLPITVQKFPTKKSEHPCSEEEIKFLHSLELHKDEALVAVNKPSGMPVQGGIGVYRSLDELAASYMKSDTSEPLRLVHRLDRDSSGILVMARTQLSATILHSIFREKTFGALNYDPDNERRMLHRRYWALVFGCPRRPEGLISKPLAKVMVDNGKSERITVVDNVLTASSQHATTKYRVIDSRQGYTWLELSPLTGRKHQLRVHCAEVLGTPIVGDYKYGWQAHREWNPPVVANCKGSLKLNEKQQYPNIDSAFPFGLDLEKGSVFEKRPRLHLHCREMVLPNVSKALQDAQLSDYNLAEVESLELIAPLPLHMQKSYDYLLKSSQLC